MNGKLVRRMGEVVDGQYQKYVVEGGAYIREDFFGKDPELKAMVEHLSDEQLRKLNRGGHDTEKVYAAYLAAVNCKGAPSVILAKTIKGYGLGESGEGRNSTHQEKKRNVEELREFRSRFGIPISDEDVAAIPFYRPAADAPEMQYLHERRKALGGFLPQRRTAFKPLEIPAIDQFQELLSGSAAREFSTTGGFGRLLNLLLRNKQIGKYIVPIIPDEARTFGMEAFFSQYGIYASTGQLYEPVDSGTMAYYREAKTGQILEEGITEAGAMSSFIAASTAYSNLGVTMIPFYIYYSMFGFQRIGDLVWAAADMRCKGFMLGGTAGRTTLNGEGLQHEDGHSHLLAATVPNLVTYDPAYAYETAVIVQDGLRRMFVENEPFFYYLTLYNEDYVMPPMPAGAAEGIIKGMHKVASRDVAESAARAQLLGSGTILREVLAAHEILANDYQVASDVWSVTSYKELRRDALEVEHWNVLHPFHKPRTCYVENMLSGCEGPFVATSDYMQLVPEQIAKWVPGRLVTLGTDGFGRSDSREELRRHFEVDAAHIAFTTLSTLARQDRIDRQTVERAAQSLGIDPEKTNPVCT